MLAHLRAAAAYRSMSPVEILLAALILGVFALGLASGMRHARQGNAILVIAGAEAPARLG